MVTYCDMFIFDVGQAQASALVGREIDRNMLPRTLAIAGVLFVGLLSFGGFAFGDAGFEIAEDAEALPNACRDLITCCDADELLTYPEYCTT